MKIHLTNFENNINLEKEKTHILRIEDKKLFINLVEELNAYNEGIYLRNEFILE